MKRKIIELKEFEYNTVHLMNILGMTRSYAEPFIIETHSGIVDKVIVSTAASGYFSGNYAIYHFSEVAFIEDRGAI